MLFSSTRLAAPLLAGLICLPAILILAGCATDRLQAWAEAPELAVTYGEDTDGEEWSYREGDLTIYGRVLRSASAGLRVSLRLSGLSGARPDKPWSEGPNYEDLELWYAGRSGTFAGPYSSGPLGLTLGAGSYTSTEVTLVIPLRTPQVAASRAEALAYLRVCKIFLKLRLLD